jgi:predicted MPP superfamily phosphohydrolase
MRKRLSTLLIILLIFPLNAFSGEIIYPWRAASAIVKSGESFNILYKNENDLPIDSVVLVGPYNRVLLHIDEVLVGRFEYDHYTKASVNQKIRVHTPQTAPEELYDLLVFNGGKESLSPRSVKVVKEFSPSHTFIHITDLHMTRQWVGTPENGYAKELELFDGFVKVANLIAPDYILITGDNIHEYTMFDADSTGWGGNRVFDADKRPFVEEKYANLFYGANGLSGLYGLNAPRFMIPGNHDFYGIPIEDHFGKSLQWNNYLGKRVHGFSYAGTRVILADDCLGDPTDEIPESAPMSGMQGRVHERFLKENGTGSLRILAQHRHNIIDTTFLNKNRIHILLNGHNHSPFSELLGSTPTLNIRPGVVCRSGEINNWEKNLGFFRIFYIDGDKFDHTPPLRFCKNPTSHYKDLDLNLTLDFKNSNDGNSIRNEAIITNDLPVDLSRCKIRFVMKKGEYKVAGGTIHQVISTKDFSVVDVYTDVRSNENKMVRIFQAINP